MNTKQMKEYKIMFLCVWKLHNFKTAKASDVLSFINVSYVILYLPQFYRIHQTRHINYQNFDCIV